MQEPGSRRGPYPLLKYEYEHEYEYEYYYENEFDVQQKSSWAVSAVLKWEK